jgi:hypothetical protein
MASSAGFVAWVKAPDGGETCIPPKSMIGFIGSTRISPFSETRATPRRARMVSMAPRRCLSESFLTSSTAMSRPESVSKTEMRNASALTARAAPTALIAGSRDMIPAEAIGHSSMATIWWLSA